MSERQSSRTTPIEPGHRARLERRAEVRRQRVRRRRLLAAGGLLVLVLVLVIVLGGSSGAGSHGGSAKAKHKPAPIVPGGPLAPASYGGLAALWAPANVVGSQPGTAAAYEAASRRATLPGYLMIADRANNRILVTSPEHNIVFRYPAPGDRGKLFFDDDTFIEPGGASIISNEEENNDVLQIDIAARTQTVLFGEPGVGGSDAAHLRSPDDAYKLPDGSFTLADADNCRVLFIRERRIVRTYGHSRVCRHDPPRYFNQVNGDTPVPGGGVLVSEIEGNWIDEIGPEGALKWSVQAPVSYPSDPQPLPGGRVLVADYSSPGHVLIIDQRGKVLWRYGPTGGHGRLDHPSLAMGLPNGDVAVNDDFRDRVVVIDPRTNEIVWQYGHTDVAGSAAGYLNTPDGMDFVPAGANGAPDYAAVVHP